MVQGFEGLQTSIGTQKVHSGQKRHKVLYLMHVKARP